MPGLVSLWSRLLTNSGIVVIGRTLVKTMQYFNEHFVLDFHCASPSRYKLLPPGLEPGPGPGPVRTGSVRQSLQSAPCTPWVSLAAVCCCFHTYLARALVS